MPKCPKCGKDAEQPQKAWKYSVYDVKSFNCPICETQFREYSKSGKHAFTLKHERGKKGGFVKV